MHQLDHWTFKASPAGLGWDEAARGVAPAGAARVTRVDRGSCDAFTATGPVRAHVGAALLATVTPCAGDWVLLADAGGRTTVEAVLPRRTAFVRASVTPGTSQSQVLAANADVAAIVEGVVPEPDLGRIERFLTLAWGSGALPVVLLTKADLLAATPGAAAVLVEEVSAAAPGVEVLAVSVLTGEGVARVRELVPAGRTLALLGPSGSGKSSLTNALADSERMATRDLRADLKGRHTTAHRELVALPGGGLVLDTPGLRSVGLTASDDDVDRTFADVEALAGQCRFGDCGHEVEPGCAVLAAVEAGDLPERRVGSWRKLQREARWMAMRHDARLRAVERDAWKRRQGEVRRSGRTRP